MVPIGLLTALALVLLAVLVDVHDPGDRLDLVKTGFTIGAGTGGVAALVLTARRQWSTERAAADQRHDAAERRLTELYLKAIEQLGSDKPPVRHGGVYGLERVAQNNPEHRQAVVDVLCAYLRTPYTPPQPPSPRPGVHRPLARTGIRPPGRTVSVDAHELLREREVRLTVQAVLSRHLHPGPDPDEPVATYWPGIALDLREATLIDFDLRSCRVDRARFERVTFLGGPSCRGTTFLGDAFFDEARMVGYSEFAEAVFHGHASFERAKFERAIFIGTHFDGSADFTGAHCEEDAHFSGAVFSSDGIFNAMQVGSTVSFMGTVFANGVEMMDARLGGSSYFHAAKFAGSTMFLGAEFGGAVKFPGAKFRDDLPEVDGAWARLDLRETEGDHEWPDGYSLSPAPRSAPGEWALLVAPEAP
ncbi:hypothetical protein H480_07048 [Amycolatopsis vancoresmycina DSM 44592]|uniref:Pentapeptide repeat-containing protein n=1 Tax=Amycolatopsis vancoresmycina DSM 44592 TaxID=1292037 RepID=R1IFZ6_9PSEU|nr:hypothetical protein H480_07048 [Amycolatopsis vancoresmycina DSM 44592]